MTATSLRPTVLASASERATRSLFSASLRFSRDRSDVYDITSAPSYILQKQLGQLRQGHNDQFSDSQPDPGFP